MPGKIVGKAGLAGKDFAWSVWGEILNPAATPKVTPLASYAGDFYAGKPAATRYLLGDGSVSYVAAISTDGALEREVTHNAYRSAGQTPFNLPKYVFLEWTKGLYTCVNYTSEDYKITVPMAKRLVGTDVVAPGGVSVWK